MSRVSSGILRPWAFDNGLAVDADGRLLICQQGERRVARLEKNGTQTILAAKFDGRRFNEVDGVPGDSK